MAHYYLGIDYGTGGAKACIIDDEANVCAYAYREYSTIINKPGWSEHDAAFYWEVCCELIKECIQKSRIKSFEIIAIGTSSALPCLVMIDEEGRIINNAYNLMDRRATREVQWIKDTLDEDYIFELTGNRLDDHPLIVNLLWEKNNRPESYRKIYKALTIDGFIRYKLCGAMSVNISNAAFYGVAYDIRKHQFSETVLRQIGVAKEILPEIFACETIIGTVTKQSAEQAGLAEGIAVIAGTADAPAAWMGAGAITEGDTHMNLGTCGNFGVIHKDTVFLKTMLVCAHSVDCENQYVTIPTTTTGGRSMRYLRDQFSEVEISMEKLTGMNAYESLDLEAERIPAGSEGLIILPYLMGERTPIWNVNARGVIFGLSLNHGKAHIVRAMMESVAFALYHSYSIIKLTGKKMNYPFVLNEGGATSKIWRRIITDVFDVPTVKVKNRIGAPYGDAVMAAVATGCFKDYSITREKAEYVEAMEPEKSVHEMYMDYFELYKKLYTHNMTNFDELAQLRQKYLG